MGPQSYLFTYSIMLSDPCTVHCPPPPSLQAYAVDSRIQWVREWPGQVVICVSQIYWTAEVHEAIRSGSQGLKDYHEKLKSQVYIIVTCIKTLLVFSFYNC